MRNEEVVSMILLVATVGSVAVRRRPSMVILFHFHTVMRGLRWFLYPIYLRVPSRRCRMV